MLVSDDQVFSFGLNNFEHLGVPIEGEAPTDGEVIVRWPHAAAVFV